MRPRRGGGASLRRPGVPAALAAVTGLGLLLGAAGCAGGEDTVGTTGPPPPPPASTAPPRDPTPTQVPTPTPATGGTQLTVTLRPGPQAEPRTFTVSCAPAGGTHPDAEAACAALAAARDPFAPVPPDVACTQIYGGPETATVTGTYAGEPVHAAYARNNGCEIARWDHVAPLLGGGRGPRPAPGAT